VDANLQQQVTENCSSKTLTIKHVGCCYKSTN